MAGDLTLLVYQAWEDLGRAVACLTTAQASARPDGHSAIAWTVGHVTQQVDSRSWPRRSSWSAGSPSSSA